MISLVDKLKGIDAMISVAPTGEVRIVFDTVAYGPIATSWEFDFRRKKLVFCCWAKDSSKTPALLKNKKVYKEVSHVALSDFMNDRWNWQILDIPWERDSGYDFYVPRTHRVRNEIPVSPQNLPLNVRG